MNVISSLGRRFRQARNPFLASAASLLVMNDTVAAPGTLQRVIVNFLPANTRMETLEDRSYTVIPMVMMVEGVHAGSGGPIYYPPEELSKTPQVWNHKPIVVYHPDGSACDPVVVENRKVGMMMNTKWDAKGKRLLSEAWLERTKADKVDNRVFKAVDSAEMMEVSTGLYVDLEQTTGTWGAEDYDGIARNLRADHLALLPDKIGACSIADGAGLYRNSQMIKNAKGDPAKLMSMVFKALQNKMGLNKNEMSFSNVSDGLRRAIQEKVDPNGNTYVWVCDVYSNFFVYEYDGKQFRLSYSSSDTGVTLGSEKPVEVTRVTEYRTVDGAKFVGNDDQPKPAENENMNRPVIIAAILAANCGWSDQKVLEGFNDSQLTSIHNGLKALVTPPPPAPLPRVENDADKKALVDAIIQKNEYGWTESDRLALMTFNMGQLGKFKLTTPATNENKGPVTMAEWEKTAPAEVVATFKALKTNAESEKVALIEKIAANTELGFTKEHLATMDVANLQRLSALADKQTAATQNQTGFPMPQLMTDYSGMQPAASLTNEQAIEEAMPVPTVNFAKPGKGRGKEAAAAAA